MVDYTNTEGTSRSGISRLSRNLLVANLSDTVDLADSAFAFEVRNDGAVAVSIVWISAGDTSAAVPVSEKVPAGSVRVFSTAVRRFLISGSDLPATLGVTCGVLLHIS